MGVVKLDAINNQFPPVITVDANKRGDAVDIFMTRIEGQGAALRIRLTSPQWENLKFLVDGPKPAGFGNRPGADLAFRPSANPTAAIVRAMVRSGTPRR